MTQISAFLCEQSDSPVFVAQSSVHSSCPSTEKFFSFLQVFQTSESSAYSEKNPLDGASRVISRLNVIESWKGRARKRLESRLQLDTVPSTSLGLSLSLSPTGRRRSCLPPQTSMYGRSKSTLEQAVTTAVQHTHQHHNHLKETHTNRPPLLEVSNCTCSYSLLSSSAFVVTSSTRFPYRCRTFRFTSS